ncbi:MAG: response regulator [Candidatus Omnitrophota bacterium]|nr:MAG: response regulator [Candidatus Omnitrophota bacterium]
MKKPTIVAIDDEIDFIDMLENYFKLRGYKIDIASSATQGLELINNKKPDIVILDLKMPGINGEELLGLLKSKRPKTKVIFVSAFDDAGKTKIRLLNAGAYAYLDKPLSSLRELKKVIDKACKKR